MRKTLRVYIRPEPRFSAVRQEEVIEPWDGPVIRYEEKMRRADDPFPQREGWIRAMRARADEVFGVSDFHRLAPSADELKEVRAQIRKKGIVIIELRTGRRSNCASELGDMVQEALEFYSRRSLSTAEARKLGKLGAAASPVTKAQTDRLPNEAAEKILNDHETYPTLKLALRAINNTRNAKGKKFSRKWTLAHIYQQVNKKKLNLKPRRSGPRIKQTD